MIVATGALDLRDLPEPQRRALLAACDLLIDQSFEDLAALDQGAAFRDLWMAEWVPTKYLPRYDALFAKKLTVCLIAVAGKLTDPHPHLLASVAEEMALAAIVEQAATDLEEAGREGDVTELRDVADGAFQDRDFELLFNPRWDGIEETEAGERLAMANLRFEDWFRPFRDEVPVHPYVTEE